jgi:hypothetical protein
MSAPRACDRRGCIQPAHGLLCLKVWAAGVSKETHTPLELVVGLALCEIHRREIVVLEFLDVFTRASITRTLRAQNKADPDWEGAEVCLMPFTAPKVIEYERMRTGARIH